MDAVVEDPFKGFGIEIVLGKEDDFLKVKETLTRIGVSNPKKNILYQSCHILHKRGRYSIIHFKELYALDSVLDVNNRKDYYNDVCEDDIERRNKIVSILQEWGLLTIKTPLVGNICDMSNILVVKYKDLPEWQLKPKYVIGKYKNKKRIDNDT